MYEKMIVQFDGEKATQPLQPGEDIWGVIEELLYVFWELEPRYRDWKRKAVKENFALFDYHGVLHDVFALEEGKNLMVFVAEE